MQGGCVSAHAAVIATFQAPAICHRAIATVQALAMCHCAIASVQAPAMCYCAIATAQALAMLAMCHCQKLSMAGVHTSGVPHASFLLSYCALSQ